MTPWEIHPMLVHFPLALLLAATTLDVVSAWKRREDLARVGYGLLVTGILCALVAAAAGLLAYFTVRVFSEQARVRMLLHPFTAVGAVLLYAIEALLRRKRRHTVPRRGDVVLSIAAALLLGPAGALGGYLVYRDGVGVSSVRGTNDARTTGALEDGRPTRSALRDEVGSRLIAASRPLRCALLPVWEPGS